MTGRNTCPIELANPTKLGVRICWSQTEKAAYVLVGARQILMTTSVCYESVEGEI